MTALRKLSIIAFAALFVGAFGVLGLRAEPKKKLKVFSHKFHIDEQEASCSDCHDTEKKEQPWPQESSCQECHDHKKMGTFTYPQHRQLKIPFKHILHAESLECTDCHKDIKNDTVEAGTPFMTPEQCFACHEKNDVDTPLQDCAKCHGVDARTKMPTDHEVGWDKQHGPESEWRVFGDHGRDCNLCHTKANCQQCHIDQRPADHNGLWRMRSHGKAAEWDRDRCKTCHETGTCIQCHRDTKPLNHTGLWKYVHGQAAAGEGLESCRACHRPGWCAACHQSAR